MHVDINGISLCKPPSDAKAAGREVELEVEIFYPFKVLK